VFRDSPHKEAIRLYVNALTSEIDVGYRWNEIAAGLALEVAPFETVYKGNADGEPLLLGITRGCITIVRATVGNETDIDGDRIRCAWLGRLEGATLERERVATHDPDFAVPTEVVLEHDRLPGGRVELVVQARTDSGATDLDALVAVVVPPQGERLAPAIAA
jgi:hypothetical protein